MITGMVTPGREAGIRLQLEGDGGRQQEIETIVDTGFTGFLTLPSALIVNLGLRLFGRAQVVLGDGSTTLTDVYTGRVNRHGQALLIEIEEADTEPLVGMALLHGSELRVQVLDGGSVTITELP